MAERYRIRRLSADDIQDAEAKRRAAINAERIKLGYSRKEAASALPGAAFLAQGKRARSQQTGERAEFFKAQQTEKSMLVANAAAAARHGQLLRGQQLLQASAERAMVLAEQEAKQKAEQKALAAEHFRRQEQSLAAVPDALQYMATAALKLAERATDAAAETTEAAEKTNAAAQDLARTAKELVPTKLGLIAGHVLADGVKEVQVAAHAARCWAPASAAFRPTIREQQAGLAALGNELHEARMQLARTRESQREEGEIFD